MVKKVSNLKVDGELGRECDNFREYADSRGIVERSVHQCRVLEHLYVCGGYRDRE
jgi:hypothetical protein